MPCLALISFLLSFTARLALIHGRGENKSHREARRAVARLVARGAAAQPAEASRSGQAELRLTPYAPACVAWGAHFFCCRVA